MGANMKTTIELSDVLFNAAKAHARQNHSTLRALIEEGLRRVLNDARANLKPAFKLKDASVSGQSVLVPEPREWHQMELEHINARAFKTTTK